MRARTVSQISARLAERVKVSPDTTCMVWAGAVNKAGYGTVWFNGRTRVAHRVVYEAWHGPIPEGLVLDHLCRNRACVNPAHLEPVTDAVNVLRGEGCMAKHARKTHCPKGHPYEGDNLMIATKANGGRGARRCRECKKAENAVTTARVRERRLAAKAAA